MHFEIGVREIDPVFDDLGTAAMDVVYAGDLKQQHLVSVDVQVHGRGPTESGKTAKLTLTFRAILHDGRLFVPDTSPDGWLKVKTARQGEVALPHTLQVQLVSVAAERESVRICEGSLANKLVDIALMDRGVSRLMPVMPRFDGCKVRFDRSAKLVTIDGLGTFPAETSVRDPIRGGTFDLEIPDYPHLPGVAYKEKAPHARTWFRIGHSGDRYLHVGRHSRGCITIKDIGAWEQIYFRLIYCRVDSRSVGWIEVT